jgi:hypothetical protein
MRLTSPSRSIAVAGLASICLLLTGGAAAVAQTPSAGPASYINPDKGMPTENSDVDPSSSCETPDQTDGQTVGTESSGAGNVHNDACLLDASGNNVDAQVAFESSGAGLIFGCPDPDGDGPKTASNTKNRTLCVLSGFEAGGANGAAGDGEYHARLVSGTPGVQTVTFCADPEGDGCSNAAARSSITITWSAASSGTTANSAVPAGGVQTGRALPGSTAPVLPLVSGLALAAILAIALRRNRTSA